jgi:hypothetical protein
MAQPSGTANLLLVTCQKLANMGGLREALNDSAEKPRFIETVPRAEPELLVLCWMMSPPTAGWTRRIDR